MHADNRLYAVDRTKNGKRAIKRYVTARTLRKMLAEDGTTVHRMTVEDKTRNMRQAKTDTNCFRI